MSAVAASAEALTEFETDVAQNAQRFDLRPLVDILCENGYSYDEIRFESAEAERFPALVTGVRFEKAPHRAVVITVQLGLLGDNTLLPSYFEYIRRHSDQSEQFMDFLRFFDHCLIENLFWALHPERAGGPLGDWQALERAFLRLSIPGSVATLHGIAQVYFPDLGVRVERHPFEATTTSEACWTGLSQLDGSGVLGRTYVTETSGFAVDLIAEDEIDESGRTWADIVQRRLKTQMLPLLAPFRLALVVTLRVLAHKSWAYVDSPSAVHRGHLGYDRVRGGGEVEHMTLMYRGVTGTNDDSSISWSW